MAAPKKKVAQSNLRKAHGPKRKHPVGYSSTLELQLARMGLLKKAYNVEARKQSEADKAKNKVKSKTMSPQ